MKLYALTGRIDERLAIYVEDDFAKAWVSGIVRIALPEKGEEIGIYALSGDGRAYDNHMSHRENPAFKHIKSLCILDGDSSKSEEAGRGVLKLPGEVPESTAFDFVKDNLDTLAMKLAIAMHMPAEREPRVIEVVKEVALSNRDPHLLFNQVGQKLNFTSETIVTSAFVSLWIDGNKGDVERVKVFVETTLAGSE